MVALPAILQTPAARIALGVAALGTLAYLGIRDDSITPKPKRPNCDGVGTKKGEIDGVHYIEHVTKDADPDAELPMLIVFHSKGATPQGSASFKMLPPTRVIRPYGAFEKNGKYSWFTTPSRGDEAELTISMKETAKQTIPFIRDIQRCRPTKGRPVVTGSSQGGMMSYLMASTAQPYVQGAVGVLGRLPEPLWNVNMAPTVGLHGTRDKTVSYEKAKEFADAMGFPFYSYDAGHGVTSEMSKRWISEVKTMLGHGTVA